MKEPQCASSVKKRLDRYGLLHADAKEPLNAWYRIAKRARWRTLVETREVFPHADPYGECTIFNISSYKYRLITKIYFIARNKKATTQRYAELLVSVLPKPIETEAENERALAVVNQLMSKGEKRLTAEERW